MRWIGLLVLALVVVGCSTTAPDTTAVTSEPQPAATVNTGTTAVASAVASAVAPGSYPAPQGDYPAPNTSSGYPAPVLPQGPAFTITEPVKATDTEVRGTGPAGVPIRLIDITNGAEQLAAVAIGSDGTFVFDVSGKLISGNRIGLMLNESAGLVNREEFISGPGYQDIPQIGVVFDNTSVE